MNTASAWRNDMVKRRGIVNPTVELWDLLLDQGFPFLKRELLSPLPVEYRVETYVI
jgi:hypothetical protein